MLLAKSVRAFAFVLPARSRLAALKSFWFSLQREGHCDDCLAIRAKQQEHRQVDTAVQPQAWTGFCERGRPHHCTTVDTPHDTLLSKRTYL